MGTEVFYSKTQAYLQATKTGVDPEWIFNNLEFAKFAWDQEPQTELLELYRLRALQLREKYDWIRLECSGGSDSTTVAYSFLLNGIHLDEIVFRYPKAGEKDSTGSVMYTKAENTLAEWKFAAQPFLNWVKTNFPKTKVTVHDYSEFMLDQEKTRDESWIFDTRHWYQPGHADKYSNFFDREHRDIANSGKSICALYGIDKPKVILINDNWYLYFLDVQANHPNPNIEDYTNITSELFYWTPDLPELVCKQAHMVANWFDLPHNQHLKTIITYPVNSYNNRSTTENIIKGIVYPQYDLKTWQTDKSTSNFYAEMDHWFYNNFQDTKYYQIWQAGLHVIKNGIDSKYFTHDVNNNPTGLQINSSGLYYFIKPSTSAHVPAFKNNDYAVQRQITTVQNKKIKKLTIGNS